MNGLRIVGRRSSGERCAICHGALSRLILSGGLSTGLLACSVFVLLWPAFSWPSFVEALSGVRGGRTPSPFVTLLWVPFFVAWAVGAVAGCGRHGSTSRNRASAHSWAHPLEGRMRTGGGYGEKGFFRAS